MTDFEKTKKRILAQRDLEASQAASGSQAPDGASGTTAAGSGAAGREHGQVLDGLRAVTRVVVESPFAGDTERHIRYARRAVRDSLLRGEAPIASHLLHTQPGILDDDDHAQRGMGLMAGWAWIGSANLLAVYADLGISAGMQDGVELASRFGVPIEFRTIDGWE